MCRLEVFFLFLYCPFGEINLPLVLLGQWAKKKLDGMKLFFQDILQRVKRYLATLSFRTGVVVLSSCVLFYALSFAALALPVSATSRGALWFILFGCAKTTQYGGLLILGVEGVRRLKAFFRRKTT